MRPSDAREFDEQFRSFVADEVRILCCKHPSGMRELRSQSGKKSVESVTELHALFRKQQRPTVEDRPLKERKIYLKQFIRLNFVYQFTSSNDIENI